MSALGFGLASCSVPTRVFEDPPGSSGTPSGSGAEIEASGGDAATDSSASGSTASGGSTDASGDAPSQGTQDVYVPGTYCGPGRSVQTPTFSATMAGCYGEAGDTWANRQSICAAGCRVCALADWTAYLATATAPREPQAAYWLDDDLSGSTGTMPGACAAELPDAGGISCPDGPMHLCPHSVGSGPSGDTTSGTCQLHDCGFGVSAPNEYLGGCGAASTDGFAGALCCCP